MLKQINGFDETFFYWYEEVDLCHRIWKAGHKIIHTPEVTITHLGGQSVGRFRTRFEIETYRNRYRYFYKHYGREGVRRNRRIALLHLAIRRAAYGLKQLLNRNDEINKNRLEMLATVHSWNKQLDPVRFCETGEEPNVGYEPLAPAPKMAIATA